MLELVFFIFVYAWHMNGLQDMLCKHNCEGAFWMGNLKNRDLQGNEIFSQSQSTANVTNQEACIHAEVVLLIKIGHFCCFCLLLCAVTT